MILSKKENHMATLHMSAAEYRMYVAAESQKKVPNTGTTSSMSSQTVSSVIAKRTPKHMDV